MVALDCLYLVRLSATLLRAVGSFTLSKGGCPAWLDHQDMVGLWGEALYFLEAKDSGSTITRMSEEDQS